MDAHANLLRHTRAALETVTYSNDYNVVLADEWMILIPRSHKGHDNVGANGAGMLGMIWLRDQEERDGWEKLGMTKHLAYLGIPGRDGVLL